MQAECLEGSPLEHLWMIMESERFEGFLSVQSNYFLGS